MVKDMSEFSDLVNLLMLLQAVVPLDCPCFIHWAHGNRQYHAPLVLSN